MPDLPISGLTAGNPAQDADFVPIERSGATYNVTVGSIRGAGIGLTGPFWWGSFEGGLYGFDTQAAGQYGTGTGNQVKCSMVRLAYPIVVTKISTLVATGGIAAVAGFGYYTTAGAKIFSWDNIDVHTNGIQQTTLSQSYDLAAGYYYAAAGLSNTTAATSQCGYEGGHSSEGIETWNTFGTKRSGTCANPMAAGVMPATLGVISVGGSGFNVLPHFFMEP